MKTLFLPILVIIGLGFGCATPQPETEASFDSVPDASRIDPALGNLASITGAKVYEDEEKPSAAAKKKKSKAAPEPAAPIVVPDTARTGTVMTYNQVGRFVVLNYPLYSVPAIGERVFIYRNGLKTGEAKITGPRRDDNIVADLVTGEAAQGDEARDK